jgi:hypothetical protein
VRLTQDIRTSRNALVIADFRNKIGTKQTWWFLLLMSAFGGKSDIDWGLFNVRF